MSSRDELRLSPLQQGLLLDTLSSGHPGVGIEQFVVDMPEVVDADRMRAAFAGVLARHEALRCSFRWQGALAQRVHRDVVLPFAVVTVADERGADAWLDADGCRPFSLDTAPMLRVALLRMSPEHHRLVFTFHHILLDARSVILVVREAFAAYDDGAPPAPTPAVGFSAHLRHIGARPSGPSMAFFTQQLEGFAGPPPLPFISNRAALEAAAHRERSRVVPADQVLALEAAAHALDVRVSSLVHAAWALLLGRHGESDDVTFGALRACRRSSVDGADEIVGLLVNTLPIRVRLDPNTSFRELATRLRAQWVALRDHEHTPLTQIRALPCVDGVPRLFDSFVNYDTGDMAGAFAAEHGPWAHRRVVLNERTAAPLSLSAYHGDDLRLTLEYDTSLYDTATVDVLLEQVEALLLEGCERPDAKIGELRGLSAEARAQIIAAATGAPLPQETLETEQAPQAPQAEESPRTILSLIAAQTARSPDRRAVSSADGTEGFTYAELERRAVAFARRLRARGVGRGDRVGLCVGRELELAVGVLGILRSGAAFVPLDPAYPKERLALVIEDAEISLVATTPASEHALVGLPVKTVPIKRSETETASENSETASDMGPGPEDVAYVIYTSGSTGTPKGVPIRHRSLARHALAARALYDLVAGDRVPHFASISFDIALEEIFPTWAVGAELVLRPDDVLDIGAFTHWLEDRGVTVLQLPTAYFERWVDGLLSRGSTLPHSLRIVIIGGEAATLGAFERFREVSAGRVRWVNAYGPTEATITATTFEIAPGDATPRGAPPIGRPVPGTFAYVLDGAGQLPAIGVPGELHLGGESLSPGYLHQPERSAERFISNPVSHPGAPARLYATGDRVRLLASGDLEFLGRTDRQVKVRGFRIELGEVEAALSSLGGVASAAAQVVGAGAASQLVGYAAGTPKPDPAALRRALGTRLPAHMVPAHIVALDQLPSLPNGKVDHEALPLPQLAEGPTVAAEDRPRTLVEHMVFELWRDVLGRTDIGIHDNFFAKGGDSLQAIRMLDRTNRMGLEVDGAAFFASPTIVGVAGSAQVPQPLPQSDASSLVTLQPRGTRAPLYFMHSTPGDLLGYGPLVYDLGDDQPCYGFQSRGLGEPEHAHRSIEAMAGHYARLLRRFDAEGPYFLAGWCFGGHLALETARCLRATGATVAPVILVDAFPATGRLGDLYSKAQRAGALLRLGPRRWVDVGRRLLQQRGGEENLDETFQVDLDAGAFANRRVIFRHNLHAGDAYRTRFYAGPVMLIRCHEAADTVTERDYGWSRFVESIEIHDVAASHETLLKHPHASEVAHFLREFCDRVVEGTTASASALSP